MQIKSLGNYRNGVQRHFPKFNPSLQGNWNFPILLSIIMRTGFDLQAHFACKYIAVCGDKQREGCAISPFCVKYSRHISKIAYRPRWVHTLMLKDNNYGDSKKTTLTHFQHIFMSLFALAVFFSLLIFLSSDWPKEKLMNNVELNRAILWNEFFSSVFVFFCLSNVESLNRSIFQSYKENMAGSRMRYYWNYWIISTYFSFASQARLRPEMEKIINDLRGASDPITYRSKSYY